MEQNSHNPKFRRHRRFLIVLPLLALPFITLMFWALGGGKTTTPGAQLPFKKGINTSLPDPNLKEYKESGKLSYYEKAASEAAKPKKLIQKDPHYGQKTEVANERHPILNFVDHEMAFKGLEKALDDSTPAEENKPDQKAKKVYQKLEELNEALNRASTIANKTSVDPIANASPANGGINAPDLQRLEAMMQTLGHRKSEDPELQQLNGMLEKILDIQHPERVQEKLRLLSEERKGEVYAVSLDKETDYISFLGSNTVTTIGDYNALQTTEAYNGFYAVDDLQWSSESSNAITAVIHDTQTVTSGATVKLRLSCDIYINGVLIPKGSFLFGEASIIGERLIIKISSVRHERSLFPVTLAVYDLDGLNGIYIPGAITRDVAKQSTDRAVQTIGVTSFDPSFQAQATSAGIEAAQSLLSKKVKMVKVTVKAGHQVLLLDEKQNPTIN